jgi:GNAT superfamily N-acetyltransferase
LADFRLGFPLASLMQLWLPSHAPFHRTIATRYERLQSRIPFHSRYLNSMHAQIFDPHEVDLSRHVSALRKAFHGSAWAGEISATLTEDFYGWKYHTPAGRAKVAYIMSGSEPVSGLSAFPMTFERPNQALARGWQIGDIMTAPEARGRGLYGKCLSAMVEQLNEDLLICFPNRLSRRSIEQAGFVAVADVDTFVRPLLPSLSNRGASLDEPKILEIPQSASTTSQFAAVHKDPQYFAWRYIRHPVFDYQAVEGSEGLAIVRSFKLFGVGVAIIMEFHPVEKSATPLLNKVHQWARQNGMIATFLMANWFPIKPIRSAYVYIPSGLMPKRQVLYVRYPRGKAVKMNWKTQIGDWDGL